MTPRALLFIVDMTVLGMGIAVVERLMFIFLLNDLKVRMRLFTWRMCSAGLQNKLLLRVSQSQYRLLM
jgi:hypothetical protein